MNNREKGSAYEERAASFLISKNYTILERNYRRKTGEIDLIAKDPERNEIVFVEVKFRTRSGKGFPEESVTPRKQQRIYRTAEWYLMENGLPMSTRSRFDVVSILSGGITHRINAFGGF